jgi:hypothetical protein
MDVGVLLHANEYCIKIQMNILSGKGIACGCQKGRKSAKYSKYESLNAFLKKA